MLVTLDAELQKIRKKNKEDFAKFYGGGQPGDEIGAITTPPPRHPRPTIRRRR